uniref:HAT C-terminal dimerisation domain-containing protein n=1 Tax=Amphimedon queenslandica TaxID=400682 RepID=A0A1X7UW26_AMPQE
MLCVNSMKEQQNMPYPTFHFMMKLFLSAQFLNFDTRETAIFSQVEHFLNRYPTLLNFSSPSELLRLIEVFISFQLLERNDIPDRVWDSAIVSQQDDGGEIRRYFRMDIIWSHISTMRSSDGSFLYGRLAKVSLLVLVIPHSNAEEVFSLITKNKTGFRPSLKLDGTLSSIIQVKLANPEPCHRYEPTKEFIGKAKTATMTYNKAHLSSYAYQLHDGFYFEFELALINHTQCY